MVGLQSLDLPVGVRIPVPQPDFTGYISKLNLADIPRNRYQTVIGADQGQGVFLV